MHMAFDGWCFDVEPRRNLLVQHSVGDHPQDFDFAVAQSSARQSCWGRMGTAQLSNAADDRSNQLWPKRLLPDAMVHNRRTKRGQAVFKCQVAARSQLIALHER